MRLPDAFRQTRGEREAYRLALGLFFGALLGTNLAALDTLSLGDYVTVVGALAGIVMGFQLIGRARSRRYALIQFALMAAVVALLYVRRDAFLADVPAAAANRLFATLGVWFVATVLIEMTPTTEDGR